jgi:hypothetical protein
MSPIINVDVGFNCDNSFMLSWTKIPKAESYEVLSFINSNYLEPLITIDDTVVVLDKSSFKSEYYAVRPIINKQHGRRSFTYDYSLQGVNCYYKSFSATLVGSNDVELSLQLSTAYNVRSITFEKLVNGTFIPIGEILVTGETHYSFEDVAFESGVYQYRARIALHDGLETETDTALLYYSSEGTYLVFPNPLNVVSEPLQVLTNGEAIHISISDVQGRVIQERDFVGNLFRWDLSNLTPGVYIYRIFRGGLAVTSGRLVVY